VICYADSTSGRECIHPTLSGLWVSGFCLAAFTFHQSKCFHRGHRPGQLALVCLFEQSEILPPEINPCEGDENLCLNSYFRLEVIFRFLQNLPHCLDQFGLSCARVEEVSPDERLNTARQVHRKIYKNVPSALSILKIRVGLNAKSDNGGRFAITYLKTKP